MSNFKNTVYSIFLNERKDIIKNPKGRIRMDPDNLDGKPTTPKQKLSIEASNARMDAVDAQDAIDAKAFEDAKKAQAIQDAADALAAGKAAAAKTPAAADNRGREEAVGMVASGEATSMGDARNRMGVRDQVAAERARMAKNPVREVGIASPSSQIGGAGTQYGNSPNRAPETEAEIQYRTGTSSAPTANAADIDPITGKPKLFSARDNRTQKQKIIPGLDIPAQEAGPWHEFDVQNGIYDEKTETEDNQQYLPPAKTFKADTTPGSEPGGWVGEDQGMADLHNTPAWKKMWAAGQDLKTQQNMKDSQKRQEDGRAANKARNDEQAAGRRAKRDAAADALRSATFEKGSNGVQRMVRPGSSSGGNGGGGGGFGSGGAGSNGPQRMGRLGSNRTQGSNGINNYGSAGSQTSPDPDGLGAGGSNFNTGTTEVNLNPVNANGTVNGTVLNSEKREGDDDQSGISTSAGGKMIDQPFGIEVSNDKQQNYTNPETGNVGRYSGTKILPSGKLPNTMTDGYSHNKALTFFAEQLKRKYIEEEVVNPENQPMTKSEISHRDKIRHKSPAKDARIVKSADKTKENAAYRLATYITMRGRKGKKKENK